MTGFNFIKTAILSFLVAGFTPPSLASGFDVGNGGDAVVCQGLEKTYILLDLYEWDYLDRDLTQITVNGGDAIQVALARINLLERLDPIRFGKFKQLIDKFTDNRDINWSDNLRILRDSGLTVELPPNCSIVQAAIQVATGQDYGDMVILMNRELWDSLSVFDQAALMIHEAVYREAVLQGHTNSFNVRRFVRVLFSQQLESMTGGEYQNYLRKFMLPSATNSEKIRDLVQYLAENFSGRTFNSIVRDERLSGNQLRTSQMRRSFGPVRAYGSEIMFEETQMVSDLVWDFDPQRNQRSNLRQSQYSLVKFYRFTQMQQSGEILLSIYPEQDSRQENLTRVETGRVVSMDSFGLVITYETDQYTEIVDELGQSTPSFVVTQESFKPKNGENGAEIKADRQLFKVTDLRNSFAREPWRSDSVLSR